MNHHKAKRMVCALCLGLPLLGMAHRAAAATITNYLHFTWNQWQGYYLAVNVGDTVVWFNDLTWASPNSVESYGGEWKSPPLYVGDSFSFTFTNSGFYAYRTGFDDPRALSGAITVAAWTNEPPAVTINVPADGSVLSHLSFPLVQASVTNTDGIAEIQYFANGDLIGIGVSPPYGVPWTNLIDVAPGQCVLLAKAVDRQGKAMLSPPVNVLVAPGGVPDLVLWGPRTLPGGKLLFFYNAYPFLKHNAITCSDSIAFSNPTWNAAVWHSGVFVDDLPASAGQCRFYRLTGGY